MTEGPFGENTVYFLGFGLIAAVALMGVAVRIARYLWKRK
jgi:hypothetical protein